MPVSGEVDLSLMPTAEQRDNGAAPVRLTLELIGIGRLANVSSPTSYAFGQAAFGSNTLRAACIPRRYLTCRAAHRSDNCAGANKVAVLLFLNVILSNFIEPGPNGAYLAIQHLI